VQSSLVSRNPLEASIAFPPSLHIDVYQFESCYPCAYPLAIAHCRQLVWPPFQRPPLPSAFPLPAFCVGNLLNLICILHEKFIHFFLFLPYAGSFLLTEKTLTLLSLSVMQRQIVFIVVAILSQRWKFQFGFLMEVKNA